MRFGEVVLPRIGLQYRKVLTPASLHLEGSIMFIPKRDETTIEGIMRRLGSVAIHPHRSAVRSQSNNA